MNKIRIGGLLLCMQISVAMGQVGSISPYSQYGLGDLQHHGFVSQLGMGGCGVALNDTLQINIANPASYASLKVTLFDAGLNASVNRLSTSNKFTNKTDAAFSYFALGFPVVRGGKLGGCFGLIPYSTRGYSVNYNTLNTQGDKVTHYFEGSGGVNRFFVGLGSKVWRNFSVGGHASYLFGTLSKTRRTEYADNTFLYARNTLNTSITDFMFDAGAYYKTDSLFSVRTKKHDTKNPGTDSLPNYIYKKKYIRFSLGAASTFQTNLKDKNDFITETYYTDPLGTIYIVDTAEYIPTVKGKTTLPASYRVGFSLQNVNHWIYTAEYQLQDWSKFTSFGINDNLQSSFGVSTGFEFIPKFNSPKYGKRIAYRFGFRYNQSMLNLRSTPITDMTLSFGVGLPIRKDAVTAPYATSFSRINLSLEVGKRGTTTNNLLLEEYIRLHVGVCLSELWFIQRKFD